MGMMTPQELWKRFRQYSYYFPEIELGLDISRMNFTDSFWESIEAPLKRAFDQMDRLEKGGIANPEENRMVGHYWLRNPSIAPNPDIRSEIEETINRIKSFASQVHDGTIAGARGPFENLLLIGIGGSCLGPQFVANALGHPLRDKLRILFLDNTDPDGMDRVLSQIITELGRTLCLVISKSGGTKETRNGMLEVAAAYKAAGLNFNAHAVAITGANSQLEQHAISNGWLKRFPMWDWVGGRTSELSAVGLLPAALQGINIDELLAGARACDLQTRKVQPFQNPSALLAAMWFSSGNGKGTKSMVVLPYKDRLELFSKYLQQLVMESIGKEKDLDGKIVNQGLVVYGNKGSTDQHAYIQQLRDGQNNFFATFLEVLEDRSGEPVFVEEGITSGDYLHGFLQGTREALFEKDRESMLLTIPKVTPFSIGVLIALFERAVGFYASLIGINAYHQPGVEAGKKASEQILLLQKNVLNLLRAESNHKFTVEEIAQKISAHDEIEQIFRICERLSFQPWRRVFKDQKDNRFTTQYFFK